MVFKRRRVLVIVVLLTLMVSVAVLLTGHTIIVQRSVPRKYLVDIFASTPLDKAYYRSLAGDSLWKSLKSVNPSNPIVRSFLNYIKTILFDYKWARNMSLYDKYRVWLVDSNGLGPATKIVLFNNPEELYEKYGIKNVRTRILVYDQEFLGKQVRHDLSGFVRIGKVLLPHGIEMIIIAVINNDNVVVGYDNNGRIYNVTTLKFIIYIHPYDLNTYRSFLEIHRCYGKPPPLQNSVYVKKVKPSSWKWVLYKTFIIANKPMLVLKNKTRISLEYVAVVEEYPYTGCDTEILWSLFYKSLVFSLALNLALPENTSEAEYYYYALKTANTLMTYKLYYYPESTMVYCLPELVRIGGYCYEHALTGMELYNLVFRIPYFIVFMRSRITGLGHVVGVVVIPYKYLNETRLFNKTSISTEENPYGGKLLYSGIDFDGDGAPDYIVETVNTGGTSIYEKMLYHPGELMLLLDKKVLWGLDHYYPFKFIIETPFGESADISQWSGLQVVNSLLASHPWFKIPYYSRSEKIFEEIHYLEGMFAKNRASIPVVGTPPTYNISTLNKLSYDMYVEYVVKSSISLPEIPSTPSNPPDTSWIPEILVSSYKTF